MHNASVSWLYMALVLMLGGVGTYTISQGTYFCGIQRCISSWCRCIAAAIIVGRRRRRTVVGNVAQSLYGRRGFYSGAAVVQSFHKLSSSSSGVDLVVWLNCCSQLAPGPAGTLHRAYGRPSMAVGVPQRRWRPSTASGTSFNGGRRPSMAVGVPQRRWRPVVALSVLW